MERFVVGIDLGTTHTVVAHAVVAGTGEGAVVDDPVPHATAFVGAFARNHGAKVPGRLIVSAKSWLCVPGVDRTSPILPWAAAEGVDKLSPVDVQARLLAHVKGAWDQAHKDAPLAQQEV